MRDNLTCAICLESNHIGDQLVQDCCKNTFHASCLKTWFKTNNTCPLCRAYCSFIQIIHINFIKNNQYNIIGTLCKNDDKNLANQVPQAWIDESCHISLMPLYTITNKFGNKTFISYYLRQILLWEEFESSKLVLKFDKNKKMFLCTTQSFNYCDMTYGNMFLMVEWIHEVMTVTKNKFNFCYLLSMNSILLDLIMATIKNFKLKRHMFQTVIVIAIYNIVKIYLKHIPDFRTDNHKGINFKKLKQFLIWVTSGGCNWDNKIEYFQKKIIEYHVEMFINV